MGKTKSLFSLSLSLFTRQSTDGIFRFATFFKLNELITPPQLMQIVIVCLVGYYGVMINPNKKWWLTDISKRRRKSRIGMGPCDTYYPMDECMQKKYI